MFNATLGAVVVTRMHELGLVTTDDLQPVQESFSKLVGSVRDAEGTDAAAALRMFTDELGKILPPCH